MANHYAVTGLDNHVIHSYTYANAAARLAATGFVAGDIGKSAKQTDTGTFWLLTSTSPTWAPLGGSGGGGGGVVLMGGTSLPVPVFTSEFDQDVYKFSAGGTEAVWWRFKVPSSFTTGNQIQLFMDHYSPSTSNTILLSAIAYLIRPGTDANSSTANAYTSTNAAITLSGAANLNRTLTLDLTDASGVINSISVLAGHSILVKIFRGTDTDTADVRLVANSGDPKFS